MSSEADVRCGDRVRKPHARGVYVVTYIDRELDLAHLREDRTGRMDCAYLERLRRVSPEGAKETESGATGNGGRVLRGAEIRKVAVRVLRSELGEPDPIHYRRWLEAVKGAGYAIAGQREDAVFLSQIARSPVVRSTARPGVYEIDTERPAQLVEKLELCRARLGAVGAAAPSTEARHTRDALLRTQGRLERELAEAVEVLGDPPAEDRSGGRR